MKYAIVGFTWEAARTTTPFLFTVEGEPVLLAEWKQYGGKTRQTCTLAECEALGLELPEIFGGLNGEAVKLVTAAETERDAMRAERDAALTALANARAALNAE